MSGSQTPSSVSSSSTSSRSSYRRLDTDTTPSPSSGNKSSGFNPRVLSNRLAIIEASQALAHASKTLSVAAQAMSKAAISLAAVSGHEQDYDFEEEYSDDIADWIESPDWSKPNYTLPLPGVSGDEDTHTVDQGYRFAKASETPTETALDSSTQSECISEVVSIHTGDEAVNPTGSTSLVETQQSTPSVTATQEPPEDLIWSSSWTSAAPSTTMAPLNFPPVVPTNGETEWPFDDRSTKGSEHDQDVDETPFNSQVDSFGASGSNILPDQPTTTDTEWYARVSTPTYAEPMSGTTHIILKHGFDLLPSLCRITERCAKTVCLYNYSGLTSTLQVAVMLRANLQLPVMVPDSTKADKLATAANKFDSVSSGILLWPGFNPLPTIRGLTDSPDIQLIHLGHPTQTHAKTTCSRTTIIQARSDLNKQEVRKRNQKLDQLNNVCNQEGPASPLQPYRTWLRAKLAKDTYARGFYQEWILQRRKQNPNEGIVEIVRRANQYAAEFLLRGNSHEHGKPIGRQPTVWASAVKSNKLEPAVQAGLLLVSR